MTKRSPSKSRKLDIQKQSSPGRNVLLTLTLVPLVVGILFIVAWALDFSILDDAQSQVTIGILFFLFSFAASNTVQKRWGLAAGWGLLMCADLVILAWLHVWAQIAAIGLGLMGLILLGTEFYRQYRQAGVEKARK